MKDVPGVYQPQFTYSFRVRATSIYHKSAPSNTDVASVQVGDGVMVPVAGGTFQMGSNDANDNAAGPPHSVTLGSYFIDKYEITYEKWTEVRDWALTHGYVSADIPAGMNGNNPVGTKNPVNGVSWYDILKWCNARSEKDGLTPVYYTNSALSTVYRMGEIAVPSDAVKWTANGYRLPTEAEWEFAAKGGIKSKNFLYSGSNTVDSVAWFSGNSGNTTHTVGGKAANEIGIHDMSGNVREWCWDWSGSYPSGTQTDPTGPASGIDRVMRGGSYLGDVGYVNPCRSAVRYYAFPSVRYFSYGFRCVKD
jgi:formylglycine-generating enzyme required for sulfatase activity